MPVKENGLAKGPEKAKKKRGEVVGLFALRGCLFYPYVVLDRLYFDYFFFPSFFSYQPFSLFGEGSLKTF